MTAHARHPDAPAGRSGRMRERAGGENFPVAVRLLPAALRADLLALYAFARTVDDLGDEGPAGPAERLRALDAVDRDLDRLFAGQAPARPEVAGLAAVVERHQVPRAPFSDLVEANRRDQSVAGYRDWDALRDYCRLSADPVGRLVLAVTDCATPARTALSDSVCTALQLLEHLQDVGEDARRGRVYLPVADRDRFGVGRAELHGISSGRGLRALVAFEVARARELLGAGPVLVAGLRGPARLAVAGFVAGGLATCEALARAGFEVLADPVRPRRTRTAVLAAGLLARRRPVGAA